MITSTRDKPGVLRQISGTFLAGLLAALPLALTLAVIVWLVEFIHRFMGPGSALGRMLRSIGLKFSTSEFVAYLIGIVLSLTLIYFLGVLVETGVKNRWSTLVDGTMDRVPLVRSVYSALKKLMQMFEARDPGPVRTQGNEVGDVSFRRQGRDGRAGPDAESGAHPHGRPGLLRRADTDRAGTLWGCHTVRAR